MKIANFPAGASAPALPVHTFIEQNYAGLRHAAHLLGGDDALRLVDRIHASLQSGVIISRRTRISLDALRDLLHLENASDPDRPEAGFFARIDPCDPVVEDICLLTDGLDAALAEWDALPRRADRNAHADRDAA